MFNKISHAKYHFNHSEFEICTPEVKDLIKHLLVVNPEKRFSAVDALNHKWFQVTTDNVIAIDGKVLQRLQ